MNGKLQFLHNLIGKLLFNTAKISAYEKITELDREIVCGLVESITVFEKDKSNSPVTQEVKIEYRFIKNLLQKEKEDIA